MPRKTAAAAATKRPAPAKTATRRRVKATSERSLQPGHVEREHVATRAYYIHLESGGQPLDNWLQAERELLPV